MAQLGVVFSIGGVPPKQPRKRGQGTLLSSLKMETEREKKIPRGVTAHKHMPGNHTSATKTREKSRPTPWAKMRVSNLMSRRGRSAHAGRGTDKGKFQRTISSQGGGKNNKVTERTGGTQEWSRSK